MNSIETGRMNVFSLIAAASLVIACAAVGLDSAGYPVRDLALGLLLASWALCWSYALSRARWPGEDGTMPCRIAPGSPHVTLSVSLAAALCMLTAILVRRLLPEFDQLRLLAGAVALLLGPGLSLGCVLLDPGTPLRERLIVAPSLSFGSILVATAWMAFLGVPLTANSMETTGLALVLIGVAGAMAARSAVRAPSESP